MSRKKVAQTKKLSNGPSKSPKKLAQFFSLPIPGFSAYITEAANITDLCGRLVF